MGTPLRVWVNPIKFGLFLGGDELGCKRLWGLGYVLSAESLRDLNKKNCQIIAINKKELKRLKPHRGLPGKMFEHHLLDHLRKVRSLLRIIVFS